MRIKLRSFAKLNLGLDVLGKLKNGYHLIQTIYQTIDLADTIEIDIAAGAGWEIRSDAPDIPRNEKNIAWKALERLKTRLKNKSVKIFIHKKIPHSAGLGGGSANASAVLTALNRALKLNFSQKEIYLMAARIGADCPFFLEGGTALGIGVGDVICPLPDLKKTRYILVVPPERLLTKDVYDAYDEAPPRKEKFYIMRDVLSILKNGDPKNLSLKNALEVGAFKKFPKQTLIPPLVLTGTGCRRRWSKRNMLSADYRELQKTGLPVGMTGSGSGIYALFEKTDSAKAEIFASKMKSREGYFVHIGEFVGRNFYQSELK